MERRFLFIVLDPFLRCLSSLIKEPSFIFPGAMRGEVTQRTGGVKPELAWFSRNHFLARPQRPDQRRGRRLDFVIGQNSGLISIFNLGRQTIKTSRNKPNMSKVKRQVGPRSCLAPASCKEARIGVGGAAVCGGLGRRQIDVTTSNQRVKT